ncbi:MAG: peptidoglycan-associated lipoprotein Pal [Candidatus Binatia bacterium]
MTIRWRIAKGGFLLLGLIALGCAPTAAPKPDPALTGTGSASAKSSDTVRTGDGQRGATKESDATPSSLKALQEGKPPITPASSPLKDAFFDFDRYDLSADARAILRANADWLKGNPSVRVEIEGHCDERGTSDYNLALGAKRAQAAREYLVSLGIAPDRLSTTSYGEEIPVCQERSEDCWRQNRRARFVVLERRATS